MFNLITHNFVIKWKQVSGDAKNNDNDSANPQAPPYASVAFSWNTAYSLQSSLEDISKEHFGPENVSQK